jgi:site-specific DNA recombinase
MLRSPLYAGRVVWNRTQRVARGGTATRRWRDPAEWLTLDAPELRIIPEALWTAVQRGLEAKATAFKRSARGHLIGRPPGTRESPYLLAGISRCGVCGGTIFASQRAHHAGAPGYYRCFLRATRGAHVCSNALWLPMHATNALVLEAVRRTVLDARLVTDVCDEAVAAYRAELPAAAARAKALTRRIQTIEREIEGFERQLAAGAPWTLIAEPLTARRETRDGLRGQRRDAEQATAMAGELSERSFRAKVAAQLTAWHGVVEDPRVARPVLKTLLDGSQFVFTPFADRTGPGCEIAGAMHYTGALASAGGISVVAPTGFEPVFRRQFREAKSVSRGGLPSSWHPWTVSSES